MRADWRAISREVDEALAENERIGVRQLRKLCEQVDRLLEPLRRPRSTFEGWFPAGRKA